MLFSIILPTKNNSRTIKKCLDSIASQTSKDIEVIFVDNFSTDDTLEIAKSFEGKINIKIFQVGPERNIQRHFGFEKSSGDIVYFIDSDMYIEPEFVEDSVFLLKEKEVGGIIVPEENLITPNSNYWTKVKAFERSLYNGDDNTEAARIFKREVYSDIGGYNKDLISGEDWDLSNRVREKYKIVRTKAKAIHDEGEIKLGNLLKKKFYYGKEFVNYVKANSSLSGASKIYFFRPIFYKSWRKYLQNPIIFPGFIIMITLELFAGGLGFLLGKFKI